MLGSPGLADLNKADLEDSTRDLPNVLVTYVWEALP